MVNGGYQYSWKILLGGAGGAGKSTLIHRYLNDIFIADMKLTVGVEFHNKIVEVTNQSGEKTYVQFVIWDLGGQERFKFLHEKFIKGARAGIVLFDMAQLGTLAQVRDWIEMFRKFSTDDLPIVLVGAKQDLVDPELQEGIDEAAKNIVDELGLIAYIVTSSKTNLHVDELFDYTAQYLLWKITNTVEKPQE